MHKVALFEIHNMKKRLFIRVHDLGLTEISITMTFIMFGPFPKHLVHFILKLMFCKVSELSVMSWTDMTNALLGSQT